MKNRYFLLIIWGFLTLQSCVNLQSINTFSAAAVTGLQQATTLPTTFTQVYRQRVEDDSLDQHPFSRMPLIGIDFADQVRHDSLRSYQAADSLAQFGNTLLANYFQALANLSVTGSDFTPIQLKSPVFDQFLQESAVKLTADQTASFNRVANLLASAATGAYRRRKLANLLEQSHTDVEQVLTVLAFAYDRLAEVVAISREQAYGHYKNGLIQDPALTYSQKRALARQWLQTSQTIDQTRQAILTYVTSLKTIRAGYSALYQKRNKLTSSDLTTNLGTYASTLSQLKTDLEQLRPVYGRLYP